MSSAIIKVENLGKKYRISHQGERQRYVALRDVIAEKTRGLFKKLKPENLKSGNNVSVSACQRVGVSSTEDFWALKDVSFEIQPGEVVGIIGRNGAGKSTLLKVLSRITEPTAGRITLRGRVASLLEVGTGFHPELTGRENIFLNGAILGMSRAEIKRKFDEIVAFAEVEKFLDTPVKRYSSGMYVRLAFAVAAHLEPEILIVDEVLAVGDAEFQKKCLGKMESVSRGEGRTVLFVSHNMAAVRQLCTKGIVLRSGRVEFLGSANSAIESYGGLLTIAHEVSFAPRKNQPTITSIKINPLVLAAGGFQLEVGFESPISLVPPVPGFVIHSASGVPVYGSNPRFQGEGYNPGRLSRGIISFKVEDLPLCGGHYRLSVWLGDWQGDYDHHSDVLAFEFKNGELPPNRPSSDTTGYIDHVGKWQIIQSEQGTNGSIRFNEFKNG
jgi:lipopolysaccharide transport system ATP-binding protein